MLIGKVLFKGGDYIDQLQKIFEVLGTPQDPALMQLCSSRVLKYLRTWPKRSKAPFNQIFPRAEEDGLDLLDKMLIFDAKLRVTASAALAHPFLAAYHFEDDEPNHSQLFDFAFEEAKTIEDIKNLIVKEVNDFHAPNQAAPEIEPMSARRTQ